MIEITEIGNVSERVAGRAKACFVRRLAVDRFVVTPRQFSKTRRLITFDLRPGGRMLASCVDFYNPDEPCPANYHGLLCGHVLKAVQHAMRLAHRHEQKAA